MSKLIVLLLIMLLVIMFRPKGIWGEAKRSWEERNRILRVLVVLIAIYLIYGVYKMYQEDMIPFW